MNGGIHWEKMVELDIPAPSTPVRPSISDDTTISYYVPLLWRCGAAQLARLPGLSTLKLIIPHGGGAIPYQCRHRSMRTGGP
jgi:hypothetical protein